MYVYKGYRNQIGQVNNVVYVRWAVEYVYKGYRNQIGQVKTVV